MLVKGFRDLLRPGIATSGDLNGRVCVNVSHSEVKMSFLLILKFLNQPRFDTQDVLQDIQSGNRHTR